MTFLGLLMLLYREDPLEGAWQPTPVFLPGESHGQRNPAGPWVRKVSDMTERPSTACMDVRVGSQRKLSTKELMLLTVALEKTLESPLDCKIQPVRPKGNQSSIFFGRTDTEAETPILWPPDAKNQLIGKDPVAGKD